MSVIGRLGSSQILHHRDTEAQRILEIQQLVTEWLLIGEVSGYFVVTRWIFSVPL